MAILVSTGFGGLINKLSVLFTVVSIRSARPGKTVTCWVETQFPEPRSGHEHPQLASPLAVILMLTFGVVTQIPKFLRNLQLLKSALQPTGATSTF